MSCYKILVNNGANFILIVSYGTYLENGQESYILLGHRKALQCIFPYQENMTKCHSFGLLKVLSSECVYMNIDF